MWDTHENRKEPFCSHGEIGGVWYHIREGKKFLKKEKIRRKGKFSRNLKWDLISLPLEFESKPKLSHTFQ